MTIHAPPKAFGLDAFLATHRTKDVLRFITCGSVDDGKSTLIGRLLHDTKQLFDDQLVALEKDSRKHGTQGDELDFALLVDGLSAEREQGITIDVAYRFFSTDKRTFIVADTPGHEQYTRNMATGASTAELAILLVDARKGLTRQTRRHSLLVSLLGIRHVVLAINKMDLVGWPQDTYERIMAEYAAFAADLGFSEITGIPLSALTGDNVVHPAVAAPWYRGSTLLRHLEGVRVGQHASAAPFRMPVQWVNRPSSDFRGYSGLIAGGRVAVGDRVRVLPSGRETTVARIVTYDGDLPFAVAGQSVTLTLADEVAAARGDVLAAAETPPQIADTIEARLFWTSDRPVAPGAWFYLQLGPTSAVATVTAIRTRIDPDAGQHEKAVALGANDIGDVTLSLDRSVAFDPYAQSRETGSFILIEPENSDTVAMGLVCERGEADGSERPSHAERSTPRSVLPRFATAGERPWRSLAKAVSWRVLGSLDTMLLAYLFTRDARVSAAIGFTEVATKIALYYGHERVWARIGLGVSPRGGRAGEQDSKESGS